ncbi:hypothetical protein [Tsuneonella suprasediminis]|uniref:hypothetical protein n=1 Tax=Tsuneonella suprasediminis TaxID=2306996 RepID=UPI001403DAAE|nr:hypothetical protein [Tsuneonella suprasediminis]
MSTGRINSTESIMTADKLLAAFDGSWERLLAAAKPDKDGILVIHDSDLSDEQRKAMRD